ncbi:MAG: putative endonuclease [Flavobacteriaceae bacterium]|jgi:putative endonuclease
MKHYIYIITNKHNRVLYIGETENIKRRISQHKKKSHSNSFSARYNLDKLVYFEEFENNTLAKKRESQMKK